MKVRIEADGSPRGTKVTTEDGRDITGMVTEYVVRQQARGPVEIELSMMMVAATIEGEAVLVGSAGKAIRRVEYADGSVDEFN